MANALLAMDGPKKIIELDGKPRSRWHVENGAMHLWEGKLWRKEAFGCVLCCPKDEEDAESIAVDRTTFSRMESIVNEDGTESHVEHFHCLNHGPLDEVPYEMVKNYTVRIGDVVRSGTVPVTDTMLFPTAMSKDERSVLIDKLLSDADEEEREAGAAPEDDEGPEGE